MEIAEKKLENSAMELQISVPAEKVDLEYSAVFAQLQKTAKIDGFRKGKVPLEMIEKRFRENADTQVAGNLMRTFFYDAALEKNIQPISLPVYDFERITRGEPFSFKAVFDVAPTVELGKYNDVHAIERSCRIIDEDVEFEIDSIRQNYADTFSKGENGIVEKGDLVTLRIKKLVDSEPAGQADDGFREYSIVVGKSRDESALDRRILGMRLQEHREIEVKYPNVYHIGDLAGRAVRYSVLITDLKGMTLPELTDEFTGTLGYATALDMKVKIRERLEKFSAEKTRGEAKSEILKTIIDNSTFDIPESMVLSEMASIFRKMQEKYGYTNKSISEFAMLLGLDKESYLKKLREESLLSIKTSLALMNIAKKEEFKVDEKQYQEVLKTIAARSNKSTEDIESYIKENNIREKIETDLLLDQGMDFIYKNAKLKKQKPISLEELMR